MDKIEKKSKKKVVVVLKNRSKKLRPKSNDKGKIMYHQKGGVDVDVKVTLYSNYKLKKTITGGSSVDVSPGEILKSLHKKNVTTDYVLTDIDDFFAKCITFLTDDDFATLYLKSNFSITYPTQVTSIKTSADTLLHFKSLILLEMCKRLLDEFIYNKLKINDTESFTDSTSIFKQLVSAMDDGKLSKKIFTLLQTITYNLFENFLRNPENSKQIFQEKYPYGLILFNYLIDNINKTTEPEINNIDMSIKKFNDSSINIDFKPGTFFDIKKGTKDDFYTYITTLSTRLSEINKKFNYNYEEKDDLYDFLKLKESDFV
jgi:hypothetical protein